LRIIAAARAMILAAHRDLIHSSAWPESLIGLSPFVASHWVSQVLPVLGLTSSLSLRWAFIHKNHDVEGMLAGILNCSIYYKPLMHCQQQTALAILG
jgi:hypothetical protein